MKIVNEIINYLFNEKIITQEDLHFLKSKGFYDFSDLYEKNSWDYFYYDESEYERLWEESVEDQRELSIENSLADNRRRKQGKRARFKGAKSRHKRSIKQKNILNNEIQKKLTYTCYDGFIFNENVLNKIKQLSIPKTNKLYSLLHTEFEKCYLFWDALAGLIGEDEIISHNNQLINIFTKFNQKEENYTSKPAEIIQPISFYTLRKEDFIQNTKDWELILKIDEKEIQITNFEGKFEK